MFGERAADHLDALRALPDRVEIRSAQIGRQRPLAAFRIAAAERLPREVIVVEAEAAGEPLDALAQHIRHGAAAGERMILRDRNAEAVERNFSRGEPPHEPLVEQRGQHVVEIAALFGERSRVQHIAGIDAVKFCQHVRKTDAAAEQAVAIDVAREQRDAAAAQAQAAALPVGARLGVELWREESASRRPRWPTRPRRRRSGRTHPPRADGARR